MNDQATGVTFLIPVHNGARWLDEVLDAILAQEQGCPMEIVVVEDGSTDASPEMLARRAAHGEILVIPGPRRGATAALNEGLKHATHPIICQVDQDVVLLPGWLNALLDALSDPEVGAAQGYYVSVRGGTMWARVMGLDLEHRYHRLQGRMVDHVCTGNTAYRASALRAVGGFDEALGYGYDNDVSYRLAEAGYRLVIRRDAKSLHRWRDGWWTYLVQQYGFGYGRLDLVA
ncbi:MAG: glycosyltransferase, partial [Acidobacteriota bacterium]